MRKIDALVCRKCSDADIANPKTLKAGERAAMLPWAAEVVKNRLSKQDPEANCLPAGIPRGSPYPWRIVQTPTHCFILYEGNIHSYRQIFMNAKHPDGPDPTWYGHSVGHWEGNTLVVDTVGFNDKFWFDYKGHPHTEKLHTIERYTRTDLGHMAIEVTIDDPGAYAKPFTTAGKATLMPGTKLLEYICQENNQDLPLLQGPARGPGGNRGWFCGKLSGIGSYRCQAAFSGVASIMALRWEHVCLKSMRTPAEVGGLIGVAVAVVVSNAPRME